MPAEVLETATWWLAVAAWVAWILLGWGNTRAESGDRVFDSGTWLWTAAATFGALLAAVAATEVLPWAEIAATPWVPRGIGAIVAVLGVALRQWATLTLGRFFTQRVMVREGHAVVSSGPYRFVRHPGYSGTLLTLVGLALTLGNWISLLVVIIGFLVGHLPRIRHEEQLLERELGAPYLEFERGRKRLIPGVW